MIKIQLQILKTFSVKLSAAFFIPLIHLIQGIICLIKPGRMVVLFVNLVFFIISSVCDIVGAQEIFLELIN